MVNNVAKTKVCENCGKIFHPRSNRTVWCDECYTFTCEWCGKKFVNRRARRRKVRFCSLACANAWQGSAKAKEEARQRTISVRGSGEIRRCPTCGEKFYVPGWRARQGYGKYCSMECRDYKADASHAHFDKVLETVSNGEPTQLEIAGCALLESIGVDFLEQEVIGGKFVVDVLVPDYALVIQWDGDFWHGNPDVFSEFGEIQQANKNRDKRCDAYLTKCSYSILRFWESDVHNRPNWVASQIKSALASSSST